MISHNMSTFFSLTLISLALGAILLLLAKSHKKELSTKLCEIIGYAVVILSIIVLVSSILDATQGFFIKKRMASQQNRMMQMMKQRKNYNTHQAH